MVIVIEAKYANGAGVANALRMTPEQWLDTQHTYRIGDLIMPCCSSPAIPKLSANGHPFFAHASGTCNTSEENQWHIAAKILVRTVLEDLGCRASVEEPGSSITGRWKADVWGERGSVRLAVEIQRSYQSLRDYRHRQERYRAADVHTLWLLRNNQFIDAGQHPFHSPTDALRCQRKYPFGKTQNDQSLCFFKNNRI
ncbi:MAG: hypothetical protein HQL75_18145 [Magnetococcales bacterium]|nr:hypothetical protein [Magnetococcales bacterium]